MLMGIWTGMADTSLDRQSWWRNLAEGSPLVQTQTCRCPGEVDLDLHPEDNLDTSPPF